MLPPGQGEVVLRLRGPPLSAASGSGELPMRGLRLFGLAERLLLTPSASWGGGGGGSCCGPASNGTAGAPLSPSPADARDACDCDWDTACWASSPASSAGRHSCGSDTALDSLCCAVGGGGGGGGAFLFLRGFTGGRGPPTTTPSPLPLGAPATRGPTGGRGGAVPLWPRVPGLGVDTDGYSLDDRAGDHVSKLRCDRLLGTVQVPNLSCVGLSSTSSSVPGGGGGSAGASSGSSSSRNGFRCSG